MNWSTYPPRDELEYVFPALYIIIINRMVVCAHRVALAVLRGGQAASAESCTHPAKRDHRFPPPIAERQRLPNVRISRIFSCDQAALWMVQSVCPSVCDAFFTMFPSSYHHEIFRSYYQWQKRCPCKRSRSEVKVTEVKPQFRRFPTVTPVWIDIWWWNDAQTLMLLRRGALLFFEVIRKISRSRG